MGRRLGQHFLHDPAILDRIVAAIDPDPHDIVLEIGPGQGTLTRRLALRVGHVVAVELDAELSRALEAEGLDGVTVIQEDALRCDWSELVRAARDPGADAPPPPFKVIGNIPYYISTPLLDRAVTCPGIRLVAFLMQKEVAERVVAAPGTKAYGALSIGIQAVATAERVMTVRAGAFRPPPKVDSAVVRLTPRPEPLVAPDRREAFRDFVRRLFSQRRKRLGRSLRTVLGVNAAAAERLLEGVGVAPDRRVETVPPATVAALFHAAN